MTLPAIDLCSLQNYYLVLTFFALYGAYKKCTSRLIQFNPLGICNICSQDSTHHQIYIRHITVKPNEFDGICQEYKTIPAVKFNIINLCLLTLNCNQSN